MVSYSEQRRQKMGPWNFDLILDPLSWWKIAYTTNQENQLRSPSIQVSKDDGIHLQAHRGGTSLNGNGSELTIFSNCLNLFLLQLVSFTVDRDPLCTWRVRPHRTWTMARHATNPWKLKLTNTYIYLNTKRCSGRNTRTQVHQETTRGLNSPTSRAEEVCLKNACMNDVHMTGPRSRPWPPSWRNHKGLALWWLITLDESSPQWVPARTATVHWGRYDGRPWVARSTPHRAKSRTMMEHWNVTTDKSSDKQNVRSARILWTTTEVCSNQGFLPGIQKKSQQQKPRGNLMPKRYLHGPMTWKVMQRNA